MDKREVSSYIEKNIIGAIYQIEGELLYKLAKECVGKGVIVEIGSLFGESTAYLGFGSKAGANVKVYAIDPFDGGDSAPRSKFMKEIITKGNFLSEFTTNMRKANLLNIITTIPKRSINAVNDVKEPIELLFIDGAHRYKFVKADFINYFPKVVSGGIIAFHDRGREGVKQVIDEYVLPSDEIEQIKTCKLILYCKKK